MNLLNQLQYVSSTEEALSILLSAENALDYNKEELLDKFVEGVTEEEALALELCGISGEDLVLSLIKNGKYEMEFLRDISFNSDRCIPLIIRVLNLFLINRK